MRFLILGAIIGVLCSCATPTPLERKQERVLSCVKDLRQHEFESSESFEVCRQVFQFKKVKE